MRRRMCLLTMMLTLFLLSLATVQAEVITFDHNGNQAGFELIQQTAQGVELKFRLEQVRLEEMTVDGTVYQQVSIPGIFLPVQAGAPNLPSLGRMVALPGGAMAHLTVIGTKRETIRGIDVLPAAPIPWDTDDSPPVYAPDPAIYGRDAYWPEQLVQLSERQKMRGVDAVILGISPFQYNPVRKELIVFSEIHLRLDFEGGNGKFGVDRLRSRDWDSILRQHLLNFDSLPPLESVETDAATPDGEYEYVIITPDDPIYIAQAERLRDFRIEQGISTGVVTLTETGATAAEIEAWIDNAYANWERPPESVLMLADYVVDGGTDGVTCPKYNDYCVSDNIYADYDGDHLPDIVFARMTATPDNVEHLVDKAIDYELNPPVDPDFYENPLLACGWQTARWFCLCSEIVQGFLENELSKSPVREYALYSGGPEDGWSTNVNTWMLIDYFGPDGLGYIPLTPDYLTDWSGDADGINNAINSGAFITQHRDHGGVFGWGEPAYHVDDLAGLYNEDLTYVFSMNCLTGKFDSSSEVFAEAIHRMEHGALGVVAASAVSYSFVNDTLVFGMWDYMWPNFDPGHGESGPMAPRPAWALASAKYFLRDSVWPYNEGSKVVTYHLFHAHGDAYTTLYTETPQELIVERDDILPLGSDGFWVIADAGATMALTFQGEILGVEEATGGWQRMAATPVYEEGEALLTITKPNSYRFSEPVPVIEPCSYAVTPSSVPILQESDVHVTVWNQEGQLAPDMIVSIDGWGIDEVSGLTDVSGEITLSVLPPYGENLVVSAREADKNYYCFQDDLPVTGGADYGSAGIAAGAAIVDLVGMLTPYFPGELTADCSENEFTFFARGCGVDTSVSSGPSNIAELLVVPTQVGSIETVIGKPGFNVFNQLVAVERVYGTVSGTVSDSQGVPLAGVLVEYYAAGAVPGVDPALAHDMTDTGGLYTFEDPLLVAQWDAYVTLFGYVPLELSMIVKTGANTIDFALVSAPNGVLSGTVTEAGTGQPLEATVEIYRTDDDSLYTTVTSDPDTGAYEVVLPYFHYRVLAENIEHFPEEADVSIVQASVSQDFVLVLTLAKVLIVDDSYLGHSADLFEQELESLNCKVRRENSANTDPATWWDYEMVVYSTTDDHSPGDDPVLRAALRDYLAGDGRLLLESGHLAAMALEYEDWFEDDVLHGEYLTYSFADLSLTNSSHVLASYPNNLTDIAMSIGTSNGGATDVVTARPDAEIIYEWADKPGGSALLVWDDDPDPDHGNLVYMSYAWDDSDELDPAKRLELLENTVHYLVNRGGVAPELGTISGAALLDGESDHSGISIGTVPASTTVLTGTDGSYALTNVIAGTYTVTATKDGWTDGQVDGAEVVADQTTSNIDFLLYAESSNLPPVAENQQVNTPMNRSVDITLEATDPDGDPLTYICVDPPSNGTLDGCADGDEQVTYTPDNQFTGNDTFTFKVNDGELDSNEATVTVRVTRGVGGGGGKPNDVVTLQEKANDDD